jgi:hypothetical protein
MNMRNAVTLVPGLRNLTVDEWKLGLDESNAKAKDRAGFLTAE